MILMVNGELHTITESAISVGTALKLFKVETPDMVSVQINGEFVDRTKYDSTAIGSGDEIDFLYFMGGGE